MDMLKLVFVTIPPGNKAIELARDLVKRKIVACVNIVTGVTSVYSWKGEINTDGESLLIIKTTASRIRELEMYILKHHPYDTPEFVVITPSLVGKKYLTWAQDATMVKARAPVRSKRKRAS